MSLNCVFVIFPNQNLYPQFLNSLAITREKSQQQQMYDEYQKYIHGILLSTVYIQTTMECCQQGTPRVLSRDISVKVLGFQRQGVSTLSCSKKCRRSGVQFQTSSYWKKGRDMPTVRIMLTSTNGRFRKLCKISKTAGEWVSKVGTKLPYFVDSLNSRSRSEILDKSNTFRSSLTKCTIVSIINI